MTTDFSAHELRTIVQSEISPERGGLLKHNTDSGNELYSRSIIQIVSGYNIEKTVENFRTATDEDKEIIRTKFSIKFTKVDIEKPSTTHTDSGKKILAYPYTARIESKTYASDFRADAEIRAVAYLKSGGEREVVKTVQHKQIGRLPIMLKTICCNLHGLSPEQLKSLHEDPRDPGGYFIINGGEWSIDSTENSPYNKLRLFRPEYKGEVARCEILSKPGDEFQNQGYNIVKLLSKNQLVIEVKKDKLQNLQIPFFTIFKAFGWNQDKKIYDHITNRGIHTENLIAELDACYAATYKILENTKEISDISETVKAIVYELKASEFENLNLDDLKNTEGLKLAMEIINNELDLNILPHIGKTPASRSKKLEFLSDMIQKTLLLKMKVLESTDRDSLANKRIHTAGVSYAKNIKKHFNTIAQNLKNKFTAELKKTSFSKIDFEALFRNNIDCDNFGRLLVQSITSGNRSELRVSQTRKIKNNLCSQMVNRKNELNVLAIGRQISIISSGSDSKQSERAFAMRRVHPRNTGFICAVHTAPEGEKVGINKQMALTASITGQASSVIVYTVLGEDPDIITTPVYITRAVAERLACVYINGYPFGWTKNAAAIADKYRKMRRAGLLPTYVSIVWEYDSIYESVCFWIDFGRMLRPLLIVYNNERDPEEFKKIKTDEKSGGESKKSKSKSDPKSEAKSKSEISDVKGKPKRGGSGFRQGLALTKKHIHGLLASEITIDDLVQEGVIEYISAEEQGNCYIAPSIDHLKEDKNNKLKPYTHCDLPLAYLGVTAIIAPFADHNQVTRNIYESAQGKQTSGIPIASWPYATQKDVVVQYNNEIPIVRTELVKITNPNGVNCIVAIGNASGYNQEDSNITNKGAADRGLFRVIKTTYYKAESDGKEIYGRPNTSTTMKIKNANYDKTGEDGIILVGSVAVKGDVLIAKQQFKEKKDGRDIYVDKSVVYGEEEPAIVHRVIQAKNEADVPFVKIVMIKLRVPEEGDKFSSRAGQKGVTGLMVRDCDMPFTEDGIRPDLFINMHCIPSRMTIGQEIETEEATLATAMGGFSDGNMFNEVDIERTQRELKKVGFESCGYHKLYNPITGESIQTKIFVGPVFYQRLQKFAVDESYAVGNSATDIITYQPLDGKASHGGLRLGEMELSCLWVHGCVNFVQHKMLQHSDGYKWKVCRCGKPGIQSPARLGIYKCKECNDKVKLIEYETGWTTKSVFQLMDSSHVGTRIYPQPFTFETSL